MATPFLGIILLAAWTVIVTCQEKGESTQFLLSKTRTINKLVVLPDESNLHCQLIIGINIKNPPEPEIEDYGSGVEPPNEGNLNEHVREAGEAIFTLEHPNFKDGRETVIVTVNDEGIGSKKKTICFIHCSNITDHKTFSLHATTDLKEDMDVKVVQKIGNHECQKTVIEVIEKVEIVTEIQIVTELVEVVTEVEVTNNVLTIILGCVAAFFFLVCIILAILYFNLYKKLQNREKTPQTISVNEKTTPDQERALMGDSNVPPSSGAIVIRKNRPRGRGSNKNKEKEDENKNEKLSDCLTKLCNQYTILLIASVVSCLFAFIFAILSALYYT